MLHLPAAVGLALVGACRGGSVPVPTPSRVADSDTLLRRRAAAAEMRLLAGYDAALRRHPCLRATLSPLRAEHAAHLSALRGAGTPSAPAPSARASTSARSAQASAPSAVRGLVAAERAAARARARDCLGASPQLAGLLASIGASEASHLLVLAARP